jgi:hypothetical protein
VPEATFSVLIGSRSLVALAGFDEASLVASLVGSTVGPVCRFGDNSVLAKPLSSLPAETFAPTFHRRVNP